jgi:hypothetical protein
MIGSMGFQKFSLEIWYPAEAEGKNPHLLPEANRDDPFSRALNSNRYFSL